MRTGRMFVAAVASAAVLGPVAATAAPAPSAPRSAPATHAATARVIVQSRHDAAAAAAAVRAAGGTVTRDLPLVNGVAANLPAAALARLSADPTVRAVTPDSEVRVHGAAGDGTNPSTIKSVYRDEVGATLLAAQGTTGKGVRIALVDTGVNDLPDLAGRVVAVQDPGGTPEMVRGTVPCVDFSGEGDCVDRYGHGTFLAGLMAGKGAASGGRFKGVAPDAEIVSVKIAGRNGAADVSKVLAAIQWVVSFRDEYSIDVLNLSLGTNSKVSPQYDPLNFAVQQAWHAGIAVVVAAGNTGGRETISKPGDDPYVITVGAVDDRETPGLDDDRLPNFSSQGPVRDGALSWVKPDVVAPGGKVISLSSPGSHVESVAGPGVFAGTPYAAYRRGSGTSMSAAITSAGIALLLQRHPDWTPDRVKYALTATATKVAAREPNQVGAGLVRVDLADVAGPGEANGTVTLEGKGTGSLEGARGDVEQGTCDPSTQECEQCDAQGGCPRLEGEQTAQRGRQYLADRYAEGNWTDASWYSSQWAAPLLDTGWYGHTWLGSTWNGHTWLGHTWLGSTWWGNTGYHDDYGKPGKGGAWYGAWS